MRGDGFGFNAGGFGKFFYGRVASAWKFCIGHSRILAFLLLVSVFGILVAGCERDADGVPEGRLCLRISEEISYMTRSSLELPDTNDFILEVKGPDGQVIYEGAYGLSPESIPVPAGSCYVSLRSEDFSVPAFSRPVFGDDRCVVVPAGGTVNMLLECRQVNAGIRLVVDTEFLEAYPGGVLFLKSGKGRLMYSFTEKRYAYFDAGEVSLVLSEADREKVLVTKKLDAAEMLLLNVYVSKRESAPSGMEIQIDTARVWKEESYVMGSNASKGSDEDNSLTVNQAKASVGMKDVWVSGYVVGGDMTSGENGVSFYPPFSSDTHIALGSRASVGSKASCISVQLPKGSVRDALNLVGNPGLLGRRIAVRGDVEEKYFGVVGVKNVSAFVLK